MMRVTLRAQLVAVVAIAALSLVAVTVTSGLFEHEVEDQIEQIRVSYLPKIRLRPQLQGSFDQLLHTIQSAVEAADSDLLAPASAQHDAMIRTLTGTRDTLSVGQTAALRLAVDDYYDTAMAVSGRLIAGTGGESVGAQIQDMQAKRTRVDGLIDQVTSFDEHALSEAFDTARREQEHASLVRLVAGGISLLLLLAISIGIGRSVFSRFRELIAGFARFGRNDFGTPIAAGTGDELGEVAEHANKMADHLRRLDDDRTRAEWIRTGLAELSDQLRGALEPDEVAARTLRHLARYLDAPVAALYFGPVGGPYDLLGSHAVADGAAPARVRLGEGLVGQAAAGTAITVVDAGEGHGLGLRSGLVATAPRATALVPIGRGDAVTGVLELALVRAWRDADGELVGAARETIAIALEVAAGRAATRELLAQTQRQARELESAGAALEQRAADLARASAYKSQFLANMSHELRTPLNAIIGFSELLYDESVPLDDANRHEYLGDILTSGRHLLQLINDVLDLAKVEAGKLEFHPENIQLTRVVDEVLAVLRTTSAKHHVEVRTDIAPDVDALVLDPSRLKQVLYNYLSNAFKFTPPRGSVVVRARAEGADLVRIEVEDTGSGIAADQVPRLFGEFQQTEEGAKKSGSTGLGLALTKRIVEAQGGSVGVRSVVGAGSTFFVVLPRHVGRVSELVSSLQVVRGGANAPTVLVVEDEPLDRARLVQVLADAGYTVEAVATGAEAVARCDARTYDAITLDLLLPDMTGLDILRKLRQGPNVNVPIVVVTVVAEKGAVAGFPVHDVLAKPLADQALLASLRRAGLEPGDGRTVVLVIDDDPTSLKVMAATLSRIGYLAVCEQDPVRGLRVASEEPPAAIVLDLLMPGMTGFEFLDKFRTTEAARDVPVIVWSSKDLSREEMARLRSSAHAVVAKGQGGSARVLEELERLLPGKRARAS